ncbi:unnamed protein product [Polarella glacialis]|uniref:non-specific serine/threonine protein kinase n=1 Tax=Polarella glacialis TaxID=89957 RepID=A0A813F6P6_POLGL|nr:unnamed protein product [Polarella glacialis]
MQRLLGLTSLLGGPRVHHEVNGRRLEEERLISEGGFAFVYEVRDLDTGEAFALKKILCQDEEGLAAAKREADVLDGLPSHKNIVGYFGSAIVKQGAGSGNHEVLLLLELCPGGHLLDLLDRHNGRIPEEEIVKAFTDVAEAVFCLHSNSPPIQHRDLKLENVLHGSDGFWKVVDFGSWSDESMDLAALEALGPKQLGILSEELGRHTTMMYRPPEMVDVYQKLPVTCAMDLWMLGCILFSLMYSQHPFQDSAALAIRTAQYSLPPRKPLLSPKLVELMIWLLLPDPRQRPTAKQLVLALWQWTETQALELPAAAQERKAKLLGAAPAEGGAKRSEAKAVPRRGLQGVLSKPPVPSRSQAAADAVATPWVAFGEGSPAVGPATDSGAGDDDWGFDAFQSADGAAEPAVRCEEDSLSAAASTLELAADAGAVACDCSLPVRASASTDPRAETAEAADKHRRDVGPSATSESSTGEAAVAENSAAVEIPAPADLAETLNSATLVQQEPLVLAEPSTASEALAAGDPLVKDLVGSVGVLSAETHCGLGDSGRPTELGSTSAPASAAEQLELWTHRSGHTALVPADIAAEVEQAASEEISEVSSAEPMAATTTTTLTTTATSTTTATTTTTTAADPKAELWAETMHDVLSTSRGQLAVPVTSEGSEQPKDLAHEAG